MKPRRKKTTATGRTKRAAEREKPTAKKQASARKTVTAKPKHTAKGPAAPKRAAKMATAFSRHSFGAYLDRVLPLLGPEVKTVHFEWSVVGCAGGRWAPTGFLFPFEQLNPDLHEWERKLETEEFYPEEEDDWDPLAFTLREPGPDPEARMREIIASTIDESATLRAWVASGRRFLWSLHDTAPLEYRSTDHDARAVT